MTPASVLLSSPADGDRSVPDDLQVRESLRVLVVDDDEVDRMSVIRALRHWPSPLEVVEVASGEEALMRFSGNAFDAVLLDYRLPDMDGLEVLRRMNSHLLGTTAILMLTGMDDDVLATRCIEAGAQDFLLKQELSPRHLLRAVTHARMRHRIEIALMESHERLRTLAEQDPLTGLANRYFFDQSLRAAIPRTRRYGLSLALLLLDLDNFKLINDSHGHDMGDGLLKQVAARLRAATREGDILCRLGGDEFAVLAFQFRGDNSVHLLAQRLAHALADPFVVDGATLTTTVSIGIALCPDNAEKSDELFKCADLAMYRAKRDGRNQTHYFSEDLHRQVMRRVQTEQDLRLALAEGEFELYYQPQYRAGTHLIRGAEALIRWNHPVRGILMPGDFLDVAEDSGLIEEIGAWVLSTAAGHIAQGLVAGDAEDFHISVNVSARQLRSGDFVEGVRSVLSRPGVSPRNLELEITESVLIEDLETSMAVLQRIADLGVEIVIDDFGTGYSSFTYLKQLPISTLKVDKSFLQGVPAGEKDSRLLKALIQMARNMDFLVVVEGVETAEQADACCRFGADVLQGFFYARPMPLERFRDEIRILPSLPAS